jgi:hypothetical protein
MKTLGDWVGVGIGGREWTEAWGYFAGGGHNLLRMARLSLEAARRNAYGAPASAAAGCEEPLRRTPGLLRLGPISPPSA